MPMAGRVIFSVFAGRRRFLTILIPYVQMYMEHRVIDEVMPRARERRQSMLACLFKCSLHVRPWRHMLPGCNSHTRTGE